MFYLFSSWPLTLLQVSEGSRICLRCHKRLIASRLSSLHRMQADFWATVSNNVPTGCPVGPVQRQGRKVGVLLNLSCQTQPSRYSVRRITMTKCFYSIHAHSGAHAATLTRQRCSRQVNLPSPPMSERRVFLLNNAVAVGKSAVIPK